MLAETAAAVTTEGVNWSMVTATVGILAGVMAFYNWVMTMWMQNANTKVSADLQEKFDAKLKQTDEQNAAKLARLDVHQDAHSTKDDTRFDALFSEIRTLKSDITRELSEVKINVATIVARLDPRSHAHGD